MASVAPPAAGALPANLVQPDDRAPTGNAGSSFVCMTVDETEQWMRENARAINALRGDNLEITGDPGEYWSHVGPLLRQRVVVMDGLMQLSAVTLERALDRIDELNATVAELSGKVEGLKQCIGKF